MTIFSRLSVQLALLAIFLVAGLFGGPSNGWDVAAIHDLVEFRRTHVGMTSPVVALTQLGSVYATMGLGLAAAAATAFHGRRRPALLLAATVLIERLITDGLKLVVGRPRPSFDLHPVVTNSSSFPSGHSANSMAVFVAIALIAAPPAWRVRALAVAIGMSLLIGMSRPYLGVHWPSDVIGGWALGLMIAGLAVRVGLGSGAIEAQHDVVGGHLPPPGQDQPAR